jgi:type IV pilus assembly protein PilB
MTFANGLRALLRQDPNIIMVGEIRDGETASLAVQAALTGHLVFSTLHTNNAATSLPRLLDMGIEPFLIASTVRAVVGQRLVRHLVPEAMESYVPDDATVKRVEAAFGLAANPQNMAIIHDLEMQAIKGGVSGPNQEPSTTETGLAKLWRIKSGSSGSAYHGRLGIYEVLPMTEEIQKLVIGGGSSDDIQDLAIKEGMVTMQTDGLIKALRGETTLEEIMRVTTEK